MKNNNLQIVLPVTLKSLTILKKRLIKLDNEIIEVVLESYWVEDNFY